MLFARYAYAPNSLGYCGPAEARIMFDVAARCAEVDVRAVARRFTGAWPYQAILADLAGIDDPLDERVGRAYWLGGTLLDDVDRLEFGRRLLASIGAAAGHYWLHLTPDLLAEASATHAFHVFGVYPWSRLLAAGGAGDHALGVLDNCRIRWGRVLDTDGDHLIVCSRRLTWDGHRLRLAPPASERVRYEVDGASFVDRPQPGEWLALHWDWATDRLTRPDLSGLRASTRWQLDATNRRLSTAR